MNTPRSPLLTALLHPLNLSMLGLTVAAGLCSAWWLAPVGLVLWLVMVIAISRDPGLKMTFTRQSRQPLAQRFQTRFDHLDRARISIFNAMQNTSPSFRKAMEPIQTALDELVGHAYQLSLRMSALDNNYSVDKISNNFDDDIAKMQKNLQTAADAVSRNEFAETLKSLQTRQAQLKSTDVLLSRFEAQLTGTNSVIDGVVTGIVSLQGRNSIADKIPPLLRTIQTEQDELKQFDRQLENSSLS